MPPPARRSLGELVELVQRRQESVSSSVSLMAPGGSRAATMPKTMSPSSSSDHRAAEKMRRKEALRAL
jgi:hypothetical protein